MSSNNCYHFTGYDLCARILLKWHAYYQSLRVRARFFPGFVKPLADDARYYRRLWPGLDEDQALHILGGQGAAPNSDDAYRLVLYGDSPAPIEDKPR